jgi:hypothetical protein
LIGLGGWLLFMAKPPVAAFLALLVLIWAFLHGYFRTKGLLIAIILSISLTIITAINIEGSLYNFYMRYQKSIMEGVILESHKYLIVNDFRAFIRYFSGNMLYMSILLLMFGYLICYYLVLDKIKNLIKIIIINIVLISIYMIFLAPYYYLNLYKGLIIVFMPIGSIIYCLLKTANGVSKTTNKFFIGWCIFFLCVVFSYSIGANSGIIIKTSYVAFFIFLGILIAISKFLIETKLLKYIICITIIAQLIVFSLILTTWAYPYRQPSPLWYNNIEINIPNGGNKLLVSDRIANFVKRLYLISEFGDFKNDTPVFDLTGNLPGVAFLLNGSAPVTPWLMSSYKGSDIYTNMVIKSVPCSILQNSWFFYDNNNAFKNYNINIINNAGVDLKSYAVIGSIKSLSIISFENVYFDLTFLKQSRLTASSDQFCLRTRGAER